MQQYFRFWKNQKKFYIINIIGFSIGLAATMLLLLLIINELSFDKYFSKHERTVRLNSIGIDDGKREVLPISLRKAATDLPAKVAGIENIVQVYRGNQVEIERNNIRYQHLELLYADSDFFSIFDLKPVYGDLQNALKKPNQVVLTETDAEMIFGAINPLGETVEINNQLFEVSAIVEDVPPNTHFNFGLLASMTSLANLDRMKGLEFFTYYLLNARADVARVSDQIAAENTKLLQQNFADLNMTFDSQIENLADIHLFTNVEFDLSKPGSFRKVLFMAALSLLILLLAITNFINLFIVQGEKRSTEIGIRKINGANRFAIGFQFFMESAVIVLLAFVFAIGLSWFFLPQFSQLLGQKLSSSLMLSPLFIPSLVGVMILTILLSGSYPAFYLSRIKPAAMFSNSHEKASRKEKVTAGIVVFQSVITIFLVSFLLTITEQINFLKVIKLNYNPENIIIVENLNASIKKDYPALRERMMGLSSVQQTGAAHHIIGAGFSGQVISIYGNQQQNLLPINEYRVLDGTCEAFGLQLKEGRFFRDNLADQHTVILNESGVKMLDLADPIGKQVVMFHKPMEVIGVVEDFYYETTARDIEPLVLTNYDQTFDFLFVKLSPNTNKEAAFQQINTLLKDIDPAFVFNPIWMEDNIAARFSSEESLAKIITIGTVLSIIIAMLGLYAINSYSIMQRTKEIGIRKIVGGSSGEIVLLISKRILSWIVIAAFFAIPLATYASQLWLNNYANRISLSPALILIPAILLVVLSMIITGWESYMASKQNPAQTLRDK